MKPKIAILTLLASMFSLAGWAAEAPSESSAMDRAAFVRLMTRVAEGWTRQDTALALSAFAEDALYTEPPDFQIYRGREELRIFFDRVAPGATMTWHHLWFDQDAGFGAGEYSFKNGGRATAVHGVAVVKVVDGEIKVWREYQRRGAVDFGDFHNPEDKDWRTTVDDL